MVLFALLGVGWSRIAPGYASLLAHTASLAIPLLEGTPGTTYETVGTKVVALREVPDALARDLGATPGGQEAGAPARPPEPGHPVPRIRQGLWEAAITFNTALLAAAVLATPGWALRARLEALAIGLPVLAASHLANLLLNVSYTQARFASVLAVKLGRPEPDPGWGVRLVAALSFFFDALGAGFFVILIYVGLVAWLWPDGAATIRTRAERRAEGRRDPA